MSMTIWMSRSLGAGRDGIEKGAELLGAMTGKAFPDDLAGGGV